MDIFAKKHATGLLILVFDERMCLCLKTPYDKTAPATPNHNVSTLLNTICDAAERNSRIRKPRRGSLHFRDYCTAFPLGTPLRRQQGKDTGDKRSHCCGKHTSRPQMW